MTSSDPLSDKTMSPTSSISVNCPDQWNTACGKYKSHCDYPICFTAGVQFFVREAAREAALLHFTSANMNAPSSDVIGV